MARPADSLTNVNERLQGAGVRLKVMVRGRKLYLRGTLPPGIVEMRDESFKV